jgi:hypothetical protein
MRARLSADNGSPIPATWTVPTTRSNAASPGTSMAMTPSTAWPVACRYISDIARPLQAKSAVAFTDCHRWVGRMKPNTFSVPGGIWVSAGRFSDRSRMEPLRSNRPRTGEKDGGIGQDHALVAHLRVVLDGHQPAPVTVATEERPGGLDGLGDVGEAGCTRSGLPIQAPAGVSEGAPEAIGGADQIGDLSGYCPHLEAQGSEAIHRNDTSVQPAAFRDCVEAVE